MCLGGVGLSGRNAVRGDRRARCSQGTTPAGLTEDAESRTGEPKTKADAACPQDDDQ
jgi:hypothetical protein